jgi:competence protein ComEA
VVVDVAGRVRRPGVVDLPVGARVVDALRAAGGAVPGTDLTSLNLARPLVDGEQVAVGVEPADAAQQPAPHPGAVQASPAPSPAEVVDLNAATLEQLDSLPGVGPVLAQRILDWRQEHGRFSSVEELGEVSGIGDARLADLRPRVRV